MAVRFVVPFLILAGCSTPLPQPTLPTVAPGHLDAVPLTDNLVVITPAELVVEWPGITDEGKGGRVHIPLVDGALDSEAQQALRSLCAGAAPTSPEVILRADASLPASTLLFVKDQLNRASFRSAHLQVGTSQGDATLSMDLAGGGNLGVYLSPAGITPAAHRTGVPAFPLPAAEDVQGRSEALVAHYGDNPRHTLVVMLQPAEQDVQRLASAMAGFDAPRMAVEDDAKGNRRTLQNIEDPRKLRVGLARMEIGGADIADPAAHDHLLQVQLNLVQPGLVGFMDCYLAGLETQPELQGELAVRLNLGDDATATAVASGLGDEALWSCASEAALGVVRGKGEAAVEVTAYVAMEMVGGE